MSAGRTIIVLVMANNYTQCSMISFKFYFLIVWSNMSPTAPCVVDLRTISIILAKQANQITDYTLQSQVEEVLIFTE